MKRIIKCQEGLREGLEPSLVYKSPLGLESISIS